MCLEIILPVAAKSQKSHVTGVARTFLNAYTILSKPFLPCSIDGRRRLISTTIKRVSEHPTREP